MHLLYVHDSKIGYARLGIKLAAALDRAGIEIEDSLDQLSTPQHLTCWVSPPAHARGWFQGQHAAIFTMWEATALPESFLEGFHNFGTIIVPSEQNLELFSQYHRNVKKVNLGIDSGEWAYRKRQAPITDFKFLIGGSGSRKGQDLAFKAFRKVFKTWPRDMPVPILQFKSPKPCEFVGERIEHIGGYISDQAEIDLYGAAHCYLQPSRGEGFGLQPLQAIAQGLPTILTDAHGHAEFAHLGYGLSATHTQSAYFVYGDAGDWWEPNLNELCEYMEYVYYNYDEACDRADEMSEVAHREFNWDVTAERFINAIGRDEFTKPYAGDGSWINMKVKKFLVRVNKPWAAEIVQQHYQFLPHFKCPDGCLNPQHPYHCVDDCKEHDYWTVADVKRILWEADVLDPTCIMNRPTDALVPGYPLSELELASGLTKEQLQKLPEYVDRHSYCWTCGQILNSGVQYEPELPVSDGALLL